MEGKLTGGKKDLEQYGLRRDDGYNRKKFESAN